MTVRSPPLTINVYIIDNKTDEEESKKQFSLRKVDVNPQEYTSMTTAMEDYNKQKSAVDGKIEKMVKLLIWAMNNGKSLHFISAGDDRE